MIMTTSPFLSHMKRSAFQRKAVYDHDHHPFPIPEEEDRSGIDLGASSSRRRACRSTARVARLGSVGRRSTRRPSPAPWRWTTTAGAPTTTQTTIPSLFQKRRGAFQRKDVFDHDHHPSHFPEEEDNFGGGAVCDNDHHPFPFPSEEESFCKEGCV